MHKRLLSLLTALNLLILTTATTIKTQEARIAPKNQSKAPDQPANKLANPSPNTCKQAVGTKFELYYDQKPYTATGIITGISSFIAGATTCAMAQLLKFKPKASLVAAVSLCAGTWAAIKFRRENLPRIQRRQLTAYTKSQGEVGTASNILKASEENLVGEHGALPKSITQIDRLADTDKTITPQERAKMQELAVLFLQANYAVDRLNACLTKRVSALENKLSGNDDKR